MTIPGSGQDRIFRDPEGNIADFVFDERVADVFSDMIRRSVPAYEALIPITGLLAARHLQANTRVYDLGCSLGATTLAVLAQAGETPFDAIAVDRSPAMIERASDYLGDPRVSLVEADVLDHPIEGASVVLMNYTLQFIPPDEREALLRRIHAGLLPGGVLIVSEKIRYDDPDTQSYFEDVHLEYKRANGYSELEVSQKRTALENVMIVDTIAAHAARFDAAGYTAHRVWFQCLNWASFIAWR